MIPDVVRVVMVDRHLVKGDRRYAKRDGIRCKAREAGAKVTTMPRGVSCQEVEQELGRTTERLIVVLLHDSDRGGESQADFARRCSEKGAELVVYGGEVSDGLCREGELVWACQSLSSIERNLPAFIKALAEEARPRWEFLLYGGGASEAAQQLLTAAWTLQLEWEATGGPPKAKAAKKRERGRKPQEGKEGEESAGSLEKIARAYLLGSADADSISRDPLASTLKHPTALDALNQLKAAAKNGRDWNEWNRLLAVFTKSWLGGD